MMDYQSLLELLKNRRSKRKFKSVPIPDEYVEKIIEAARWAPSGANSQPWEFIVIKKKELKDRIIALVRAQAEYTHRMELTREPSRRLPSAERPPAERLRFEDAPVFIILCGDPRTQQAYPVSAIYTHRDSIYTSSLANAFLYMHLAAATLGLASQWVTATAQPFAQSLLKELLWIPEELDIYDMMAVGYAAEEAKPRLVREKGEMVHYEHFDRTRFRTAEQVTRFIAEIHQR